MKNKLSTKNKSFWQETDDGCTKSGDKLFNIGWFLHTLGSKSPVKDYQTYLKFYFCGFPNWCSLIKMRMELADTTFKLCKASNYVGFWTLNCRSLNLAKLVWFGINLWTYRIRLCLSNGKWFQCSNVQGQW